jgi:hypothetical protein
MPFIPVVFMGSFLFLLACMITIVLAAGRLLHGQLDIENPKSGAVRRNEKSLIKNNGYGVFCLFFIKYKNKIQNAGPI